MTSGTIDAHLHVWDLDAAEYSWLTPALPDLNRTFGFDEVIPELDACGVDRVVLVQAADNAADTEHMRAVADASERVAGIVAWLPLDRPDELTTRIAELRGDPRVVGIRCLIHDMADREWVLRPDVADGLDRVSEAGWSFDYVCSNPEPLVHVPALAYRHPDLRIVIDHLGKPPIGAGEDARLAWRSLILDAAVHPNVAAKLSGLASAVGGPDSWTVDTLRPIVDDALEVFGVERLMYGGDWPVSLLAGGYRRTFDGLAAALDGLSGPEREAVYGGSCRTWYRIDEER
jgi:L-fuconolactonase